MSVLDNLSIRDIISVSLILFSVIDIVGSIPVIISLKEKGANIQSAKATLVAGGIMILFLFVGKGLLSLFGVDVDSFAVAGAIVIFIIGLEMILGIDIFRADPDASSSSIVPIAFPLVAGAGTLTTIITLKSQFHQLNILVGILINILLVYLVLRSSDYLQQKIGKRGEEVLRKVFGIILLAIAVKIFKENWNLGV